MAQLVVPDVPRRVAVLQKVGVGVLVVEVAVLAIRMRRSTRRLAGGDLQVVLLVPAMGRVTPDQLGRVSRYGWEPEAALVTRYELVTPWVSHRVRAALQLIRVPPEVV